jgi:hypothetical protein
LELSKLQIFRFLPRLGDFESFSFVCIDGGLNPSAGAGFWSRRSRARAGASAIAGASNFYASPPLYIQAHLLRYFA